MIHISNIVKPVNSYQQKINSDQWRSRKKAWLRNNGFWCRSCKRTNVELHVHHLNYDASKEVDDYNDDELTCLCRTCHTEMHKLLKAFRKDFGLCSVAGLKRIYGFFSVALKLHGEFWVSRKLEDALYKERQA